MTQPVISLVMIVRDEGAILRETLDLVAPIVDEWIVVDTGSTDGTPAIIAERGPVHRLPFTSYVETKNAALALATGRYVLLMDADERLISGAKELREWAEEGRIDCVDGWILDGPGPDRPTLRYSRARLWRNDGRWRFEGPGCHEYVACSGPHSSCMDHRVRVYHDHRHRLAESYAARNEQYIDLLQAAIEADATDTRAWFYLARTLVDAGQPLAAISAYQHYLTLESGFRDEIYQAHLDTARAYRDLGEHAAARRAAGLAIEIDPRRAEARLLLGELDYTAQRWSDAVAHFEAARACTPPDDVILFLEPAAYATIPADYLTICYDRLARPDLALSAALASFDGNAPPDRIRKNIAWCRRRLRPVVLFALGPTPEPLPTDLDEQGAGGVETTYLELPPALGDLGADVFVAGRCPEHRRGRAYFLPYADLASAGLQPDLVVASRWFEPFDWFPTSKRIVWLQDAWFADCLPQLQRSHANIVSSPWHRDYTIQRYSHAVDPAKIDVIPLGLDLRRFQTQAEREPLRAIYSSNPDRGLVELAQMWPALRERLPGLTLTVTYGWEGLATWNASDAWRAHIERTRAAITSTMRPETGVTFTGRLGKRRLAEEMQRATVMLYPNNFQETFCLSALEAQAAGVPIVSTRLGALASTVHPEAGVLIEGHPGSAAYQRRFVDAAVEIFGDAARRQRMAQAGRSHAAGFDWSTVAGAWQRLIWRLR